MKRLATTILLFLCPALVLADGSLSFAPPASDYSVIFLGNLFGIVDGVLHGTGSQIMGTMFGVFNSAVLALGGIVIMYTLMVSTMNTAHEGQMLGQKWSSIWIPVRSTLGLALLIPKASGYCLMQIFVMWIVIQGVGAADKVWEAALSYLNRGGLIISAQQTNPALSLLGTTSSGIPKGAATILQGQVCMLGLENQLKAQRQDLLNQMGQNSGPCKLGPSKAMQDFCNTPVPDFIGSVNTVTVQSQNKKGSNFSVTMPNFTDVNSPYAFLNGICGTLTWNGINNLNYSNAGSQSTLSQGGTSGSSSSSSLLGITPSEFETIQMNRAIAIQQMYTDLSSVAQIIVNNNPNLAANATSTGTGANKNFSQVAVQQFGVPYTQNRVPCTSSSDKCVTWGASSGDNVGGVLFNGTEFQGAILDYDTVMMPTLNLMKQMSDLNAANQSRQFIAEANTKGWIMAGSYFFDLVKLQGSATSQQNTTDTNTGLDTSTFDVNQLTSSFKSGSCTGAFQNLCSWFLQDSSKLAPVVNLISGQFISPNGPQPPNLNSSSALNAVSNQGSSTVYGFINNSLMMQAPGQPGLAPLTFSNMIHFTVDSQMYYLQEQNFECGQVKILFFSFCLGQLLGNLFYNYMFRFVYNAFLAMFQQIINQVIMAFLMIPLNGMASIFKQGVQTLSMPGVNPIVALANMGNQYINFAGNLWIMLLTMSITSALLPIFGVFIFALLTLGMPLIMAWVGVMVGVGFTTAYYIPILPYLIFTFGSIAWLISVIEAMVAAPIVALGVTHPEGHDAFGKGEHAIMILMNVFLRPAMMIIGYIAAIALAYVGVWILNAGYDHAIAFIQTGTSSDTSSFFQFQKPNLDNSLPQSSGSGTGGFTGGFSSGGYTEWAGIYAFFFSVLTYTTMYLIIVQRSFTLISLLPDKVLRWIGGPAEGMGEQAAQWGEEAKGISKEGGQQTQGAQSQIDKQLGAYGQKAVSGVKSLKDSAMGGGGGISAGGTGGAPESTPSSGDKP